MKQAGFFVVAALAIAALACAPNINLPEIPRLETGPTETLTVNESRPEGDDVFDLTLKMGAGRLTLAGGAEGLIEGEIQYNIAEWKPNITREDDSLTIEQGQSEDNIGIPRNDVINKWDLKLGDAPLNLTVNAGAYEGTLDLSGVPLRNLKIEDGASQSEVRFESVNPEEMETLSYETGASSVTLTGLANANFAELVFRGGAGDYRLDFSGELQRDATVDVTSGISSVRIVIPNGVAAKVIVEGGLNNVNTEGDWTKKDDTYETSGSGPLLTIKVDMGVGSLTLVNE
jgi:hypothetical protein